MRPIGRRTAAAEHAADRRPEPLPAPAAGPAAAGTVPRLRGDRRRDGQASTGRSNAPTRCSGTNDDVRHAQPPDSSLRSMAGRASSAAHAGCGEPAVTSAASESRRRRLDGRRAARHSKAAKPAPPTNVTSAHELRQETAEQSHRPLPTNSPPAAPVSWQPMAAVRQPSSPHQAGSPHPSSLSHALLRPGTRNCSCPLFDRVPAFPLAPATSALPWFLTTRASSRSVRVVRNPESEDEGNGSAPQTRTTTGNAGTRPNKPIAIDTATRRQ